MSFIVTSILAFISTNIDDVFLLMLFFGDKRFRSSEVVIGQIVGIASLVAISLIISVVGLIVGKPYIGLLGFIPIYLGIRGVMKIFKKQADEEASIAPSTHRNNVVAVAGVTIANGGDNIGIYVPLFAAISWSQRLTMIAIFFIMTGLLCIAAKYFTNHPVVARAIDRYGHIATPFVLIFLGMYILYESDALLFYSLLFSQ